MREKPGVVRAGVGKAKEGMGGKRSAAISTASSVAFKLSGLGPRSLFIQLLPGSK